MNAFEMKEDMEIESKQIMHLKSVEFKEFITISETSPFSYNKNKNQLFEKFTNFFLL